MIGETIDGAIPRGPEGSPHEDAASAVRQVDLSPGPDDFEPRPTPPKRSLKMLALLQIRGRWRPLIYPLSDDCDD